MAVTVGTLVVVTVVTWSLTWSREEQNGAASATLFRRSKTGSLALHDDALTDSFFEEGRANETVAANDSKMIDRIVTVNWLWSDAYTWRSNLQLPKRLCGSLHYIQYLYERSPVLWEITIPYHVTSYFDIELPMGDLEDLESPRPSRVGTLL